ncbi:hypothetical protein AOLI_G00107980 [Acnodon oligacanthus]
MESQSPSEGRLCPVSHSAKGMKVFSKRRNRTRRCCSSVRMVLSVCWSSPSSCPAGPGRSRSQTGRGQQTAGSFHRCQVKPGFIVISAIYKSTVKRNSSSPGPWCNTGTQVQDNTTNTVQTIQYSK